MSEELKGAWSEFADELRWFKREVRASRKRGSFAGRSLARPAHLYVIELVGFRVKIGIARNFNNRLSAHQSNARSMGREIGRVWVSPIHEEAELNEVELKGASPTEYLERDFDDVVDQALGLTFTPVEVRRD